MSVSRVTVFPRSMHVGRVAEGAEMLSCFIARDERSGDRVLGVRTPNDSALAAFTEPLFTQADEHFFALNAANAVLLRKMFAWLNPVPLEPDDYNAVQPSFGFGDRLGLATPGHIQALRAVPTPPAIAPIFGQQSVRENARTGRTPQQVLDDAMYGVLQEGWQQPWGADADHLKQTIDIPPFVDAGYTFFTIDPGEHVDSAADTDPLETLQAKIAAQTWSDLDTQPATPDDLIERYTRFCADAKIECDPAGLQTAALRAMAKYGRAVMHIVRMYRTLLALKPDGFDFEASVDETETPTSIFEHFYFVGELRRLGVRVTSLAPRLPGQFNKGVDYVGDLEALDKEVALHAAVRRYYGGYKLSLHSGSDKFSVYPLLVRHAGRAVHVKTAGTSYLEALRVASSFDTPLFRRLLKLARERYSVDRQSYHVAAEQDRLPDPADVADADLPLLLNDFHVRQALHVTFGSALAQYGQEIRAMLCAHPAEYDQVLQTHFARHLEPLVSA